MLGKALRKAGSFYFPYLLGQKQATNIAPLGVKRHASFADLSYKSGDVPLQVENYGELLHQYSTDDIKVYKDDANKRINLSIRGTDLTSKSRALRDLKSDFFGVFLGLDRDDPRFEEARLLVDTLKTIFPEHTIRAVGFSLGGSIAENLSKTKGVESIGINTGSGLFSQPVKNSKTYRTKGDIISRLNKNAQSIDTFEPSSMFSHSLNNF